MRRGDERSAMGVSSAEDRLWAHMEATEAHLENMGLTSLENLVPVLARMPHLRSLHLARNAIRRLPLDLSSLAQLDALDLSDNPIDRTEDIFDGLLSLPALRHLAIDLPEEEEEELLLALPALQSLNGTAFVEPSGSGRGVMPTASAPPAAGRGDGERKSAWTPVETQRLEALLRTVRGPEGPLSEDVNCASYVEHVAGHLKGLLRTETDALAREGEVLKARSLLLEYCFERASRWGSAAPTSTWEALRTYEATVMDDYDAHWRRLATEWDDRMGQMKADMQGAIAEIERLMSAVANARGEETSGAGEEERLRRQVERLGRENAHLREQLHQRRAVEGVVETPGRSVRLPSAARTSPRADRKTMSLKQLREIIEEIYASKTTYDVKCRSEKRPRETMEQHMYTFLHQRFGLRELVWEWASAVVEAVKQFAAEDNGVAVFGKILRNEIDEAFRHVQQQVRETVRELLRVHLQSRRPTKGEREVERLLQATLSGTVREEAWRYVVTYMYNTEDAAALGTLLRAEAARPGRSPPLRSHPGDLPYADVVRLLLDFQLRGHETFLAPYVRLFRSFDGDQDGLVSREELRSILQVVDPAKREEEAVALVERADPFGSDAIPFSETVSVLGDALVRFARNHPQV